MTLYTKSIYAPIEAKDEIRVCVMSRLTQNDGITTIQDLVEGKRFYYWAKILAPRPFLIGSWYREEITWEEFTDSYLTYLSDNEIRPHVRNLAQSALNNDVTILCVEEQPSHCHRSILAQECKRLEGGLEIVIR